jgi:hypothetical protein
VPDEHARPGAIQNKARGCDVGLKGGFRLLNHRDRVSIVFKDGCDRLPAGTVGKCAMDEDDTYDGGMTDRG